MALFLDTSALVKIFVPERGSEEVDRVTREDPDIHLSGLTRHEFLTAIELRARSSSLTRQQADEAIDRFQTVRPG